MNRDDLIKSWNQSIKDDTFLTAKHHPSGAGQVVYSSFRSVLEPGLANNLGGFIGSGKYDISLYENRNPRHSSSPDYYVLTSRDPAFSVAGSGLPAYSRVPTSTCDRVVIVSGLNQGWHITAEQDSRVQRLRSEGKLIYKHDIS